MLPAALELGRKVRILARPAKHFIHIPKNGGVSVREALKGRVSMTYPFHYRYCDLKDKYPASTGYFSIVRNPWARVVSRYNYAVENCRSFSASDPRSEYFNPNLTFDRFVRENRWFSIPEHPDMPWMGPHGNWYNQLEWITDEFGVVVCDCLRFECLQEDLENYLSLRFRLPLANVSRRIDYRHMYTDDLAEIVGRIHADDIDYFGFTFDGAATREVAVL